jgi:hypothetical protein
VPLLEAAGCQDQEVLTHCFSPEQHFRGCWVFDLILARRSHPDNQKPNSSRPCRREDFPASFAEANRWRPPRAIPRLAA